MDKVQVDLERRIVTVTYDPTQAAPEAIKQALEAGGDTVLPAPE